MPLDNGLGGLVQVPRPRVVAQSLPEPQHPLLIGLSQVGFSLVAWVAVLPFTLWALALCLIVGGTPSRGLDGRTFTLSAASLMLPMVGVLVLRDGSRDALGLAAIMLGFVAIISLFATIERKRVRGQIAQRLLAGVLGVGGRGFEHVDEHDPGAVLLRDRERRPHRHRAVGGEVRCHDQGIEHASASVAGRRSSEGSCA